jgi:hypothetical protein
MKALSAMVRDNVQPSGQICASSQSLVTMPTHDVLLDSVPDVKLSPTRGVRQNSLYVPPSELDLSHAVIGRVRHIRDAARIRAPCSDVGILRIAKSRWLIRRRKAWSFTL